MEQFYWLSVLWTSFRTKEYPPEEYAKYNNLEEKENENPEKSKFLYFDEKNVPNAMKQLAVTQFFLGLHCF